MASTKRLVRSFYRLLFPIVLLIVAAFIGASVWLLHQSVNAPKAPYLLRPEKYGLLSTRGAKITDETWSNKDGSQARGWLLRGTEGEPAIVLLHRYGADRSWILNLGVKLNEATNFTILMPDLRGHGENPAVKWSSFGGAEAEDVNSSVEYLKTLKSETGMALVGRGYGVYGVELGALAALSAAAKNTEIKALALDSVPHDSNELLASIIDKRFPFASFITARIAQSGTYFYFYNGGYNHESMCELAKTVSNRKVILLAGNDLPNLQSSTSEVAGCFPNQATVERKLDLMPGGFNIINASTEQSQVYDQRIIDFFKKSFTENQN